jgi:hypothetical protein
LDEWRNEGQERHERELEVIQDTRERSDELREHKTEKRQRSYSEREDKEKSC